MHWEWENSTPPPLLLRQNSLNIRKKEGLFIGFVAEWNYFSSQEAVTEQASINESILEINKPYIKKNAIYLKQERKNKELEKKFKAFIKKKMLMMRHIYTS